MNRTASWAARHMSHRVPTRPISGMPITHIRPFSTQDIAFGKFKVQVYNLPKTNEMENLQETFDGLSVPIPSVMRMKRSKKGRLTGTADFIFDTKEEADAAVDALSGHEMNGKVLRTKLFSPRTVDVGNSDFLTDLKASMAFDSQDAGEDPVISELLSAEQHLSLDQFADLPSSLKSVGIDPREVAREKRKAKKTIPYLKDLEDAAHEHWEEIPFRDDTFYQLKSEQDKADRSNVEYMDDDYEASLEFDEGEEDEDSDDDDDEPDEDDEGDPLLEDVVPWQANLIAADGVAKVLPGGIMNSVRVLVTIGNGDGVGGFGIGKGEDPKVATARALRQARRNLVFVDRYKKSALVHDLEGRHNSCKVVLRAVPPGYGMKAGRIVECTLKSMGIADVTAKAYGRRKPLAVVQALFKALGRHTSLGDIARGRGRRIVELEWRKASM